MNQSTYKQKRTYQKKSKKSITNTNVSLTLDCGELTDTDTTDTDTNQSDDELDDEDIFNSKCSKSTVPKSTVKTQINNVQWINKYNPEKITDLILDKTTMDKLNNIIKSGTIYNMIISGVSGVGKTATVISLVRNLVGKYYSQAVYELNSYDEKGVKIIHEKLENFCKRKINVDDTNMPKIIILDESDNMTKKTQQTIGYLMDKYDKVKFMFTCNNLANIIESIQSRCIILNYLRIPNQEINNRLVYISKCEKLSYTGPGLDAITTTANGDMRKAINILQLIHITFDKITEDHVYNLCDKPHPKIIGSIIKECINNNIKNALDTLNDLYDDGYSSSDIALSMVNYLKSNKEIPPQVNIEYLAVVSRSYIIISKGINTKIQLNGCIASLCLLRNN